MEKPETPAESIKRRLALLASQQKASVDELRRVNRRKEELENALLRTDGAMKELAELLKTFAPPKKAEAEPAPGPQPPMIENTPKGPKPLKEALPGEAPKEHGRRAKKA